MMIMLSKINQCLLSIRIPFKKEWVDKIRQLEGRRWQESTHSYVNQAVSEINFMPWPSDVPNLNGSWDRPRRQKRLPDVLSQEEVNEAAIS